MRECYRLLTKDVIEGSVKGYWRKIKESVKGCGGKIREC